MCARCAQDVCMMCARCAQYVCKMYAYVMFDIIEPHAFRKYSTCWVLEKSEEPGRILKKFVHSCVVNVIHAKVLPGSVKCILNTEWKWNWIMNVFKQDCSKENLENWPVCNRSWWTLELLTELINQRCHIRKHWDLGVPWWTALLPASNCWAKWIIGFH